MSRSGARLSHSLARSVATFWVNFTVGCFASSFCPFATLSCRSLMPERLNPIKHGDVLII